MPAAHRIHLDAVLLPPLSSQYGYSSGDCKICGALAPEPAVACYTCMWRETGASAQDCVRCANKAREAQRKACFECLVMGGSERATSCDQCSNMKDDAVDLCIACTNHPNILDNNIETVCITCVNGPTPEARQLCSECIVNHYDNAYTCVTCMGLHNVNVTLGSSEDHMSQCFECMDIVSAELPDYICTTPQGWRLLDQ
eukprot:356704-Chlamydomonas_euryale.AAC.13